MRNAYQWGQNLHWQHLRLSHRHWCRRDVRYKSAWDFQSWIKGQFMRMIVCMVSDWIWIILKDKMQNFPHLLVRTMDITSDAGSGLSGNPGKTSQQQLMNIPPSHKKFFRKKDSCYIWCPQFLCCRPSTSSTWRVQRFPMTMMATVGWWWGSRGVNKNKMVATTELTLVLKT